MCVCACVHVCVFGRWVPIVSNKAHCECSGCRDQSNPNLQVAWQRLQPLLPPLITTSFQLACLDTRSARHETSLRISGGTALLWETAAGLYQDLSFFSSRRKGDTFTLHCSGWFSDLVSDVYLCATYQVDDTLFWLVNQPSTQILPLQRPLVCSRVSHR